MKKYLPISLLFLAACAPSKHLEQTIQKLERENGTLRIEQASTTRKLDDMASTLMVIQDRLETLKVAVERQPLNVAQEPAPTSKSKSKPRSAKEKVSSEAQPTTSAFGFGIAGSSLPPLKITNRDLKQVDKQAAPVPSVPAKVATEKPIAKAEYTVENPEAIQDYNAAYQNLESEHFAEAIQQLGAFVTKYPKHPYADNAVYWIGESYYRMREFDQAVEQFERVAREFPTGNKVPDALLRAGSCYLKLSKPLEAKRMFEKIIQIYPQSVAAQQAKVSLTDIVDPGESQRRM